MDTPSSKIEDVWPKLLGIAGIGIAGVGAKWAWEAGKVAAWAKCTGYSLITAGGAGMFIMARRKHYQIQAKRVEEQDKKDNEQRQQSAQEAESELEDLI